ncbi:hypothetical protein SNOD_05585 [Streptomyces nodosus]|uniref:Uncharacterized protein n=1 Tax=Streptomyces nodosus TaxID=40318 RepID=A0A0B5DHR7_9ACTN|nr:hypothetical protein SNOD_05585 [Streptomyces nodosus]
MELSCVLPEAVAGARLQAADVRTPGAAVRPGPKVHQLGRLGHDAVEGLEGEIAQAGEIREGLFRPIDRIKRLTSGALRGDEGGRSHGLLGFGCFEVVSGVDHTYEGAADDALTFACGCLIKVAGEVRRGVVVKGTAIPGTHTSLLRSLSLSLSAAF